MKQILTLAGSLAVVAWLVPTMASAHGSRHGGHRSLAPRWHAEHAPHLEALHERAGHGHGDGLCLDHLELTDEQADRIEAVRKEAQQDLVRLRGQVAAARSELQARTLDNEAVRQDLEPAWRDVEAARNAVEERRFQMRMDIRDVLTPEQREDAAACLSGRGMGRHREGMHPRAKAPRIRRFNRGRWF